MGRFRRHGLLRPRSTRVVDQAKRSLVPKVHPFEEWSRIPSHAHAQAIMEMGPGYPESAQPSPAMWTKRQTNSNIDGLPEHDPPKDPWFAKEKYPSFSFHHRILYGKLAVLLRVSCGNNKHSSQPWLFAIFPRRPQVKRPPRREEESLDVSPQVEGQSPPIDRRKKQSPGVHPRIGFLARQFD